MPPVLRSMSTQRDHPATTPSVSFGKSQAATKRGRKAKGIMATRRANLQSDLSDQMSVAATEAEVEAEVEAEAEPEPITSYDYWPDIRKHLQHQREDAEKGVSHPRLELTCGVCRTSCLRLPESVMSNREDAPVEDLTVLPCGHVFGSDCINTWAVACHQRREMPVCPTCRFALYHEGCGHHIFVRAFGGGLEPKEIPCRVPLTIVEGGRVPPLCRSCREEQVRSALDHTLDLIFDTSHLTRLREQNSELEPYLSDLIGPQVMNAYYMTRDKDFIEDEWV